MRIAHFADLHLDAPFKWAPPAHARRRRNGLRQTLRRILEVSQNEEVDAIFCSGDLFEHDRVSPDTEEFLRESFRGVDPIPVFVAPGNHDWLGSTSPYRRLEWSSNVHVFREKTLSSLELETGLVLWGAAHRIPAGTPGFLENFRVEDRGSTHLALFHGSHEGSFSFQEDKQPHAPFREDQIGASGLSHAFVGHYHSPQHAVDFTYPGNPDPLTFGEEGERGLVIAEILSDGSVRRETIQVASSRLQDIELDVTGCIHRDDVLDRLPAAVDGSAEAVRITLSGELSPNADLRLADIVAALDDLDAVVVRNGDLRLSQDFQAISEEPSVRGQFVRDVMNEALEPEETRRILTMGLRALEGRTDLEVL